MSYEGTIGRVGRRNSMFHVEPIEVR